MNRLKWYLAKFPMAARELAQRLAENAYSADSSDGFVLDTVRDSSVEARYFERFEIQERITDPLGREIVYERLSYRQASFRITDNGIGLEVINGHYVLRSMLSRLSVLSDFKLAIEPIIVDPIRWAKELSLIGDQRYEVDLVQLKLPEVAHNTSARVILKGNGARDAAEILLPGKARIVERVRLTHKGKAAVYLSSSGQAEFRSLFYGELKTHLRDSLGQAIGQKQN